MGGGEEGGEGVTCLAWRHDVDLRCTVAVGGGGALVDLLQQRM